MIKLCDYGCEQEAKYQFKNGKWCCKKLAVQCSSQKSKVHEWYNKLSDVEKQNFLKNRNNSIKKTLNTEEYKNKMSNIIKDIWKDSNHIYNNKEHQLKRNKILSEAHFKPESIKLKSKIMKEKWKDKNSGLNNPKRSEEASKSMLKVWSSISEEERNQWCDKCSAGWTEEKRIEKSKVAKQKWSEDDYRIKMKDGRHNSPNKEEEQLTELLDNLFPNEYKFVGNFDLFIDGKNPDFINKSNKKVIEYFGSYWHSELITGEKEYIHESERINHFINNGYDCLIVWDFELKNKKELIEKLKNFN